MRRFFEPITGAWTGIVSHKLRSSLTILGVVIGVSSVIALMAVGNGAGASILSSVEKLGANLILISPSFSSAGGVRGGFGSAQTLTLNDATAISQDVTNIAVVAPTYQTSLQVVAGSQNLRSQVIGITTDYESAYTLQTSLGSLITDYQYQTNQKVALLGATVATTLFGNDDPTGQTVRMGTSIVTIIGVLQPQGQSLRGSTDNAILVPLTSLQQMANVPRDTRNELLVSSITVIAANQNVVTQVANDITTLLATRHSIAPGGTNDFQITSVQDLVNTISSSIQTITLLLGAIAAISLLVGGIGVMNIMLVSVIERTREIGIRKALGAKEHDIWGQFLIEAAFLTLTGGVIGIGLGWAAAKGISLTGLISPIVSPGVVLLALGVSVGIGLFFGFYPAWQASHLDPIQALRAE